MTTETEIRARNLEAVRRAFDAIGAGDVDRQLDNYIDDCVLELPYSDPPKHLEGRETRPPVPPGRARAPSSSPSRSPRCTPATTPTSSSWSSPGPAPTGRTARPTPTPTSPSTDSATGLIRFQREFYNPAAAARSAAGG